MKQVKVQDLLEAGVHFGHLKSKWDPSMAPYIFMERNGIHILDLNKTHRKLYDAANAIKNIARSGRKILFVATKKQAKDLVTEAAQSVNMPYVTDRWLGGMLTNFATVRKSVKKMTNIDKMIQDGTYNNLAKRERLQLTREREKLERVLGGISDLSRLPTALFVVDISREDIAVAEAKKLNLTTFGMVDTNSNPSTVDYAIPANDDASKSIALITEIMTSAIADGLQERNKVQEEREAANKDSEQVEAKAGEAEE